MKTKTKLVAYLMSVCLVLSFAVIGILAVTSLNMKIGGDINFFAEGVSFSVGEGKFYEENGTTLYTGITSQTGILQGFSMDTDTKLTDVSDELATWTGLDLQLDSRGDAILKFNVANDMDDKELYILFTVTHGDNLNNNMKIVASTSEKISANANKDITIKFDILDMNINAGLEDFEIGLAFSEPVAVGSSGVVENISNTKYTNAKYTLNKSTKTAIVNCSDGDLTGELVIMDKVYSNGQEYIVTEIAGSAFEGCDQLTSLVIGGNIKTIGGSAFMDCTGFRGDLVIPDSVETINGNAFGWTGFDGKLILGENVKNIIGTAFVDSEISGELFIPASVISIDNGAFWDCENITSVLVDSKNEVYYSKGNCIITKQSKVLTHGFACSVIPQNDGITEIGENAFGYYREFYGSVTIPSTVKKIGNFAFGYCSSLTSITIKATTPPTLGENAFIVDGTTGYPIYVPASSVNTYKSTSGWSKYASRIEAI